MTNQEIFNTVARHLLAQGRPAILIGALCAYRAKNGDKCAFGILILDEDYSPAMETQPAARVIASMLPEFKPHDNLINSLQAVHDNPLLWTTRRRFRKGPLRASLHEVAAVYNLSTEVLDDPA